MIPRVIAVLAFAACSSKSPSPSQATPHDSGKLAATVDGAVPTPTADAGQKGSAMTPEALIEEHYVKAGRGKPVNLVPYPHVPGFFRAEWATGLDYALVKDGALVTAKGVDALAAYMKDVALLAQSGLDVDDVVTLVQFFDAYASQYLADGYYKGKEHKDLVPSFEVRAGAGRLTLNYLSNNQDGPVAEPNIVQVARVTLDISKDYELTWKSEPIEFDTAHP